MADARIAVCVATLRRAEGLATLLGALARQGFEENPDAAATVIVVDNDPLGSAKAACAGLPGVVYEVEPRRGIPQARNRGLALAREAGATHVAFIDDDEEPAPDWLDKLLSASRAWRADVVQGRVVPRFTCEPAPWILQESLFERVTGETGDLLPFAATNATLAAMEVFDAVGGFEESWALTGGTDTLLFAKAARAGFRIVWCDEAVVREDVGADRANLGWLCRRALRVGITQSRVKRALAEESGLDRMQAVSGLRLSLGALRRALPGVESPHSPPMCLRMAAMGLGMTLGALGFDYAEYASR